MAGQVQNHTDRLVSLRSGARTRFAHSLLRLIPRVVAVVLFLTVATNLSAFAASDADAAAGSKIPKACRPLPAASDPNFLTRLTGFMNKYCYKTLNWQHDAALRSSSGTHSTQIQVWYSPSLFTWLTAGDRRASIPDGAIMVKEEHPNGPLNGWSVMIKDSDVSWDGWYWASLSAPSPKNPNAPGPGACPQPATIYNSPGQTTCINCHASAIDHQLTFATTEHIAGGSAASDGTGSFDHSAPWLASFQNRSRTESGTSTNEKTSSSASLPDDIFSNVRPLTNVKVPCMVSQGLDHVVSPSASNGGPKEFLTSDQCAGCHDASGTLAGTTANMIYMINQQQLNLSVYGEWSTSMMGLAGRDPIFFAQLDTESTLHKKVVGETNGAAFVQDTCLRCHGVMGQRQFHIDKGDKVLFTRDMLKSKTSPYAALARDGVSCTVCHHVAFNDPNDTSTYTGLFKVGPPNELYGPYPDNYAPDGAKVGESVVPLPMQNALGISPKQFDQRDTIGNGICASCHNIVLPVLDAKGRQVIENGQPKTAHEQSTFLEWQDSSFNPSVPCSSACHMTRSYQSSPSLTFKVANIEDDTFPAIPPIGPQTVLPDIDITVEPRTSYARHQFLGANLFALDMFNQFATQLGIIGSDPYVDSGVVPEWQTAIAGAVYQAQNDTATVTIGSPTMDGTNLTADVLVTNLAGHDFPSGVSFRRAFINFQVLDSGRKVLWASGNTNSSGVIVDTAGNPLVTEFFSPTQQTYQPHFWTGSPITSDHQVQIFEELVQDPQGMLTTDFLGLDTKVKDNRLLPQGWQPVGFAGMVTAPVGTGNDPDYQTNGCGCDQVRYQVPLSALSGTPASVQATVYYQSIPPYYLRQRSQTGHGPDTARLINFASQLDIAKYPEISNWKLQIATSGTVAIP
jgi:hypothetical protein